MIYNTVTFLQSVTVLGDAHRKGVNMKKMINEIVGGRYLVLEKVGSGGSANVYKVKDIETQKVYALKKYITSDPANYKNLITGVEKELKILKYTQHPVIPKIYNIVKENEHIYLVMEYVEGENLKEYIKRRKPLKINQIADIMEQVCSGLFYLHSFKEPIVYRDLKPSNIMITSEGIIKLIDFGIAKRYSRELDTDLLALGSKGFAAPEQYGDKNGYGIYNTDIRSDIYGIGSTMYYLRTGLYYKNRSKSFRVRGRFKKIIIKCTRTNPNDRYQDCIEVLCAIKSLHNKKK